MTAIEGVVIAMPRFHFALLGHDCSACRLTIVGGGRDAAAAWRRGRGECAPAAPSGVRPGPSTSPFGALMKRFLGFLLVLIAGVVDAETRNLGAADIKGAWQSAFPTTKGETDELEFFADGHVRFFRAFGGTSKQELVSRSISRSNDLEIIEFSDEGSLRYKLVLAGWLTSGTKKLFGTMFMYEPNGHLFNGLPVSFQQETH